MKTILILLLSTLVCVSAVAQDAKPAVASATAPVTTTSMALMPKHQCVSPEAPGRLASVNRQKSFNKEVDAYKNCLVQFREERNKIARTNVEAGNAAVEEFNSFIAEMKKNQ